MSASGFASHDPACSPQQVAQCVRLIDGMRKINARIMRLSGSLDSLASAADRDHPRDVLPFDPATGREGTP